MRIYKKLTIYTTVIAIISFTLATFFHYCFPGDEADFWINVCLGIFGSAVLTAFTSIVSYFHERRKTLENFLYHTRQILTFANKYQEHMTLDEKLRFFLDYSEFDKTVWDTDFGNMDFFFERKNKYREYIYNNIYNPILDFSNAVANHVWHFRCHLDGSAKNERVMQTFVDELQSYLLKKEEKTIPTDINDNGDKTSCFRFISTESKLVHDVKVELAGRYYEILYGKRTANKKQKDNKATGGEN
ncbi:MAG: hypothetical protein Q4F31_09540 [Eubacteriales bacterium]|nr:hypothetical protein [Eubacteriales bacterium]